MSDVPRDVIRCPQHGMTDCSVLLNGCSIPTYLARAYRAGMLAERLNPTSVGGAKSLGQQSVEAMERKGR